MESVIAWMLRQKIISFLPTRCYASAGTSYSPVSVCLSHFRVLLKRMNESGWFFALELPLTYSRQCYKDIWVPPKIWVLPSRTLLQTVDLKNFSMSFVTTYYHLSSRKMDAQHVINWTVVGHL